MTSVEHPPVSAELSNEKSPHPKALVEKYLQKGDLAGMKKELGELLNLENTEGKKKNELDALRMMSYMKEAGIHFKEDRGKEYKDAILQGVENYKDDPKKLSIFLCCQKKLGWLEDKDLEPYKEILQKRYEELLQTKDKKEKSDLLRFAVAYKFLKIGDPKEDKNAVKALEKIVASSAAEAKKHLVADNTQDDLLGEKLIRDMARLHYSTGHVIEKPPMGDRIQQTLDNAKERNIVKAIKLENLVSRIPNVTVSLSSPDMLSEELNKVRDSISKQELAVCLGNLVRLEQRQARKKGYQMVNPDVPPIAGEYDGDDKDDIIWIDQEGKNEDDSTEESDEEKNAANHLSQEEREKIIKRFTKESINQTDYDALLDLAPFITKISVEDSKVKFLTVDNSYPDSSVTMTSKALEGLRNLSGLETLYLKDYDAPLAKRTGALDLNNILPPNLKEFHFQSDHTPSWKNLPEGLEMFSIHSNAPIDLKGKAWSDSLKSLSLGGSDFVGLDKWPPNLKVLSISNSKIKLLPLPESLEILNLSYFNDSDEIVKILNTLQLNKKPVRNQLPNLKIRINSDIRDKVVRNMPWLKKFQVNKK